MKLGQLWLLSGALAMGMPKTTQAIRFTKKSEKPDTSVSVPLKLMPEGAEAPTTGLMAEAALDTTITPRTPVTDEDKNDARQAFQKATDFVREVIEAGEPNETERQELLDLLETQKASFDISVTNSESVGDPSYAQYTQQKNHLDTLVAAQQQADSMLEERTAITPLAESTAQQLRALILYELNAKLSIILTPPDEPILLDSSVIAAIVTRSIELVKSGLPENEFLRQQCDLMQQQLNDVREAAGNLVQETEAETVEHESVIEKLAATEAALSRQKRAHARAKKKCIYAKDHIDTLERTIKDVTATIERLTSERDSLAEENDASRQQRAELNAQYEQACNDRTELQEKIVACEKEKAALDIERTHAIAQKTALLNQIQQLETSLSSAKGTSKELEIRLAKKEQSESGNELPLAQLKAAHTAQDTREKALTTKLADDVTSTTKIQAKELEIAQAKAENRVRAGTTTQAAPQGETGKGTLL